MLTAMTRINISSVKQSCFKMKTDDAADRKPPLPEDMDVAILLERLGLADIDYDEVSRPEWDFPETECTEMASRHLSGGGLVAKTCDTPTMKVSGRVTPAMSMSSQSSDDCFSHPTNPFRNTNMRLVLEADEVLEALQEEIDQNVTFSLTNPFRALEDKLPNRTVSQCSTRAVSPLPWCNVGSVPPVRKTSTQATQTGEHTDKEAEAVKASVKALETCGWYHGHVSWQDSIILLQGTPPGTFFVRDSADPNFLFSLSLQTVRGPTSVRLHHTNGQFRLDSEAKLITSVPSFHSVIELIEYYVAKSQKKLRKTQTIKGKSTKEQVWIDVNGQMYSSILLTKPLLRYGEVPSLKHVCRLRVNTIVKKNIKHSEKCLTENEKQKFSNSLRVSEIDRLELPSSINKFLKDYPYCT